MRKGWVFRMGVRIKEAGERMGNAKFFGIHVFGWCCGTVIALGIAIRNSVDGCPVSRLGR